MMGYGKCLHRVEFNGSYQSDDLQADYLIITSAVEKERIVY